MKKFTTYLILVALLAGCVSCGGSGAGSDTTAGDTSDVTTAPVETEIKPELPDKKYDGYTFTFYTRQKNTDVYVEEGDSGDIVNDAVYEANRAVEEIFGIEFSRVESGDAMGNDALNTIMANEDAYDAIFCHGRAAFTYAQQSAALDWMTDLPWVNLDAEWWAQDAKESFTIKDKLYTMIGDISWGCLSATKSMYFNMAVFDEHGWDYPYQIVRDGEWTLEKMGEFVVASSKEMNGDDNLSIDNDRLGFATTWWGTPINVLFTADQRICDRDKDGNLILTLNNERTIDVYNTFFKFMEDPACYIHKADDGTPISNAFREGRLTFYEITLGAAKGFRDMNDDFGIIPCPKYDDSVEKYITGVDASTSLCVVPVTAEDPERTSAILEALAFYGWRDTVPTFYEVALSAKFARDESSVEMLDIIRESRMFDIGYYQSVNDLPMSISSIGWNLSKMEDPNFASYYAAHEAEGLAALEKINEFYTD